MFNIFNYFKNIRDELRKKKQKEMVDIQNKRIKILPLYSKFNKNS